MIERETVNGWLSRAQESLAEAEALVERGHPAGAVNRIYYSCFYAVTALLLSEGLTFTKHSGVISRFDQHWVKPGRVPAEMGRFYHQVFERRLRGDYALAAAYELPQVAAWLVQAREFVETIAQLLPVEG